MDKRFFFPLERERSDFRTMEEELRVIVSTPSGNDCPRPGVVPFDANSSHFVKAGENPKPERVRAERGNSLVPAAGAQIFKIGRCTTKIVRAPALAVPTLKKKRLSSSSFFSFFSFLLFFFFFFFFFFPSPFLALGCILRACATCV